MKSTTYLAELQRSELAELKARINRGALRLEYMGLGFIGLGFDYGLRDSGLRPLGTESRVLEVHGSEFGV